MNNYNRIYDYDDFNDYNHKNDLILIDNAKIKDVTADNSRRKTVVAAVLGGIMTVTAVISIIAYIQVNKQLKENKQVITELQQQNETLQQTITEELQAIDTKIKNDTEYKKILENLIEFLEKGV